MRANNVVKKAGWFLLGVWSTVCLLLLLGVGVMGLLGVSQGWLMVVLSIGLVWSALLNLAIALYSFVKALERG